MRILLYGLNFEPELVGSGKFTGEMALHLAQNGHDLRVVTAPPYYPAWRIQPGYAAWAYRREMLGDIRVLRCPLWVPAHPTGFSRLLHLFSFAIFSAPALLAQGRWQPQLILAIAPTLTGAPAAWLCARLFGCPAWLHIQDFELDAALKLQMVPGLRPLGRLLQRLETWLLKRFDRISTISTRMQERLWQRGVSPHKTRLLPNWVDCQAIFPRPLPNSYRQEWGIGDNQILALYAGSMGEKQGLELVIQAAQRLQEEPRIRFVLCGEGSSRARLEGMSTGMSNLRFAPLQPTERLNELLNAANIQLLIQRADAADLVMPSKLNGMLASGKPVIATAEPGTELARVISEVGLLVPPADLEALIQAILLLANQKELRRTLGSQGRNFVLENYDQQLIFARLDDEIRQLVKV